MSVHGGDIYRNKVNIDYSVNISPYGIPPMVRARIQEAVNELSVYPDPLYENLRKAIGKADGIDAENIICGNGSSELIFAAIRAIKEMILDDDIDRNVARDANEASILIPCFSEYERAIRAAGFNKLNKVLLNEDNCFLPMDEDIDKLLDKSSVIILGNPNNPTGRLLDKQWLNALIDKAERQGTFVILDETFLPLTEHVSDYDDINSANLIRIKAYTKSMAIPGVRIGYLYSDNEEIVNTIRKLLPDWNVSIIAERAGVACAEAKAWLNDKVNDSKSGLKVLRNELINRLNEAGIKTYESDTNFVLVKSEVNLYEKALNEGILIRDCSSFEGLEKGFYRIAVKAESYVITNKIGLHKNELLSVKPAEIEKTSFEILSSELLAKGINIEGDKAPIIKRCIHTTADFQYATTLTFSEEAVSVMKKLIKEGATIITDTNMALSGINKTELSKYGCKAMCFMADPEIAKIARERGCTRATASMEHAATLGGKIIFAIGNAPTALVTLCEIFDRGEYTPDFVIGVPVGFVNVEQAKEMVIERNINYIVNRGRKGGSNVAAAIVNAVLYSMRDE